MRKIHTITVKPKTGQDAFGKATYGAEATFDARWNDDVKLFKNDKGIEIASVGTVFYDPADKALVVGDMVKYDGDFAEIQAIAKYPNASGSKQINVAYLTANARRQTISG